MRTIYTLRPAIDVRREKIFSENGYQKEGGRGGGASFHPGQIFLGCFFQVTELGSTDIGVTRDGEGRGAFFKGPLLFFFLSFMGYISLRKEKKLSGWDSSVARFLSFGSRHGISFPFLINIPLACFWASKELDLPLSLLPLLLCLYLIMVPYRADGCLGLFAWSGLFFFLFYHFLARGGGR